MNDEYQLLVLGGNKLKSRDNSTPNAGFSLSKYSSSPFSHSMVEKKSHLYSVCAFPSDEMSLRFKKVMEGLRTEFGGLEIEPHITVVGSICVRPYLSLLYGYLTEEERKSARERVNILDKGIGNLSFPITRLALYKNSYKYTICTLKSWEKIAEYPLH
ncbi:hypothetical protein M0R45_032306 [Rubus argutus]|uniref:RNA ligase/cyclic nucleotide phosphodiesterase family protein n=1 Tax=Rubus argutus TaxID=59490 RepID=A0AAW1WK29_RUBAR